MNDHPHDRPPPPPLRQLFLKPCPSYLHVKEPRTRSPPSFKTTFVYFRAGLQRVSLYMDWPLEKNPGLGLQKVQVISFLCSVQAGSPSRGEDVAVYVFDINQPSLPTPFCSVLVSVSAFMALSTVFHSINSPDDCLFSPLFFRSYFCFIGPFNYSWAQNTK